MAGILIIALFACKEDDPYASVPLLCTWPEGYFSGETVENYLSQVDVKPDRNGNDTVFVFQASQKIGNLPPGYLYPCNVPKEARKVGLQIKISGHIVRFSGFDNNSFLYGYPFEITSIEYLSK